MAIIESASAAPIESVAADPALVEAPATDDVPPAVKTAKAKAKATKAPNEKKTVTKKPSLHPTYLEMIHEAIVSLKERTGSSQYAISKFVEDKHKDHLPANFKKLLLVQLRKLTAAGKLTKVKNSYNIPAKPVVDGKKTAAKSKSVAPKSVASSGLAKAAKNSVKATPAKLKMAAPVAAKKPKTVKKIPTVKKAEK